MSVILLLALATVICPLAGSAADSLMRFQNEIDACAAKGGGVVTVPAGLHETAPLELKSNVELHLADGAELLFTDDLAYYGYREWTNETGVVESSVKSLVTSLNATNVAITGRGTLRPRMGRWECWRWFKNRHRPRFVKLMKSKGIRLEGFRLRHSPSWFVHLEECADVTVRGLDIEGYLNNNDGIDVDSTRNVLIEDCRLSVGDDVICMKSGKDEAGRRRGIPTENVLVRRCTADCGHAFLGIGSECSGGVRNVTMEDCVMDGTCAWLLRLKTRPSRGGFMENITMRNVRAKFVTDTAVQITNGYGGSSDGTVVPPTRVDGVRVENVAVREAKKAFFVDPSLGARNVEFRNLSVNGAQAELGAPSAKAIRLETRSASCQVDVRGARVTSLKLGGQEVLWTANPSDHVAGKWAHGGLPVCWPWFSWRTLPSGEKRIHGYAADRDFTVKSVTNAADRSELVLGLRLGGLALDYRLTLTDRLQVVCTTKNLGAATVPFSAAFHPYFLIGERDRTRILGSDGKDVCDLRREPTDDGFDGNGFRYVIDDPVLGRKVVVSSTASTSCNIWNCSTQWPKGGFPGIDDLPSGTWRRTVSLEPVKNFPDGQIAPGETVSLDISVETEDI